MLPAARRSASYASITGRPTARRPRATAPATRAATAAGTCRGPPCPLPLYNLPAILAAPPEATIVLLEGEKCTDLATDLGLPIATTSAHGAKSPQLSDWTPLAGRTVAILGDADADGMGYVTKVAALLAALDPPAQVRIISLPGLSDGEDIEQWADARRSAGLAAHRPPRRAAIPDRRGVLTSRRRCSILAVPSPLAIRR